jgi:rhamnulose-1-phosphate aldolase/alcohol dehydrogenase
MRDDDCSLVMVKTMLDSLWDPARAAKMSPLELLLYRSNLLGSDQRITNFGGGNTSAKLQSKDPLTGKDVEVLWVKGSGGDLGTMTLDGFASLYMDKFRSLEALSATPDPDSALVPMYAHCAFNLNRRAASIDTPLHGLIDRAHVDHMHPDAVIAIAASSDSRALAQQTYGDEIGWLPWIRPGYELGLRLREFVRGHPKARGVILEAHGLFTWGNTSKECYENTLDIINCAIAWLAERNTGDPGLGGARYAPLPQEQRRQIAAAIMPRIRGLISSAAPKVGHFDDSPAVLSFVNSEVFEHLADLGTACPDHFLRTKIRPLVLEFDPRYEDERAILERLPAAIESYRRDYVAYYERCKRPHSPKIRDPNAVVYLVPGVGMMTFAANKSTARVAAEFYRNAINVMRESSGVSSYRGLPEQEAFDIEYWPLEEAKLQRLPKPKALAGRIAFITGGAGGIGLATARRLMDEGACAILCDVDSAALAAAASELIGSYNFDSVLPIRMDVTDEHSVTAAYREAAWRLGGVDIVVSNAGIASAAPIEDTSLAVWRKNMDILSTGYFLVSREAVSLLKSQGLGGSIIFIGSKNALVASTGAAAYCTAKASELHLARCLALELAPTGIRVNVVNPDAVLRGSRIWQGDWAQQRAEQHKTSPGQLEAIYRERSLLKRSVYPEDVAEAVAFLASDRSAKSTGNIINVDAGNANAFTR